MVIDTCYQDEPLDISEINDDVLLFGMDSPIGLDSLDALEISTTLKLEYGVRIEGSKDGRKHLASINAMAACIIAAKPELVSG